MARAVAAKPACRRCGRADRPLMSGSGHGRYLICRPCNTARCAAYRRTPSGTDAVKRTVRKHQEAHPEQLAAWTALNAAVRRGVLKRPKRCGGCNKAASRIDGHHPDHSKPLEVLWRCRACHVAIHKLEKRGA